MVVRLPWINKKENKNFSSLAIIRRKLMEATLSNDSLT